MGVAKNNISQYVDSFSDTGEYGDILKHYGLFYRDEGNYLLVGPDPQTEDRKIYISIIISQIYHLLNKLLPFLSSEGLPFMIVKNVQVAKWTVSGMLNANDLGKIVVIYVPLGYDFNLITGQLVSLTVEFFGPAIPTYEHLGGLIFTKMSNENNSTNSNTQLYKILNNKYLVISRLKNDLKGDVLKCIYSSGFLGLKRCVIKEGKKYMWSDEAGRDISHRLQWQKIIHEDLSDTVKIPKILDYFELEGHAYLAMEFIKGITLRDEIKNIYSERSWLQLSLSEKRYLLDLLLKVIEILDKIHSKGYIHRDLTPKNFLIDKHHNIYVIDLELAYNSCIEYPNPPFELGSPGYMSDEQILANKPTLREDIYGLGGLMFVFFANMQPVKLNAGNIQQIKHTIYFFTKHSRLTDLISQCFESKPCDRPSLSKVRDVINSLKNNISLEHSHILETSKIPDDDVLDDLINKSIEGLKISEFVMNGNLFKLDDKISSGFITPITGILYMINEAANCGVTILHEFFTNYVSKYLESYTRNQRYNGPGLFYGASGNALFFHLAMVTGIIEKKEIYTSIIKSNFDGVSDDLGIATGIAGQLISSLLIYKSDDSAFFSSKIKLYSDLLVKAQFKNGSWPIYHINKKSQKNHSLETGIAGVVLSLMISDVTMSSNNNEIPIKKALIWLMNNPVKNGHSLAIGSAGIGLVFIYAYEHYNLNEYKNFAEKILEGIPKYIVDSDYSLLTGLSGLGLLYLEAARILNDIEWETRAAWIYQVLTNNLHVKENESILWKTDSGSSGYRSDLFFGNAGIILFIIGIRRYQKNNKSHKS